MDERAALEGGVLTGCWEGSLRESPEGRAWGPLSSVWWLWEVSVGCGGAGDVLEFGLMWSEAWMWR